ncbi:unnamed protein product [Darwinula stevensoni]|uniref:AAA+ ATPase domain-containing protein n=1 Tax=Darwinula stevensoni TaxID=69355 RepID=A0A7R8XIB8_9CRUS|nr:unnamed protein product [Darwinula stevensoni]CAG0893303.1 unnamed protein product [Darwinula stevensoni]
MLGVEMEDDWRLQMVATEKEPWMNKTQVVTAYVIHPVKEKCRLKCPLTIVDTPGFGETEGLDGATISTLKDLFDHEKGIDRLHSVGLVISASTTRLTAGYVRVIEQIQELFGTDVVNNIHLFVTFAFENRPPILEAMEKADIHYNGAYTVNNRCLFNRNQGTKQMWAEMMSTMGNYFSMLMDAIPASIGRRVEIVQHKEITEGNIQELLGEVQQDLETLERLQISYEALKMDSDKNAIRKEQMKIGRQYRATQLMVQKLILDSHASFSKLEDVALKPNASTLVAYIDLLAQQELDEGNPQRAAALKASREAAEWLTAARDRGDWDPFDQPLSELKKIGLELPFDGADCDVQFLHEPGGLIQTLKKIISNRKRMPIDNANNEMKKKSFGPAVEPHKSSIPQVFEDEQRVAERVQKMSIHLGKINGYDLYELRKEVVVREEGIFGIYHVMRPHTSVTSVGKVVMFVGMTGAGAFLLKLLQEDISPALCVRLSELINEVIHSQNSSWNEVSAYVVHAQPGSRYPDNLIIIDTPGFPDTRGLDADKKLLHKFQMFYDEGKKWNITEIHTVGLVVRDCDSRQTDKQKYVFDSVLNVFGKKLEKAFVAVITFSDGSTEPPALKMLKAGGIPYNEVFVINNSPIFVDCKEEDLHLKRYMWNTNFEKVKRFCDRLESWENPPPATTREVPGESLAIEDIVHRLRKEIREELETLELLQITYDALKNISPERSIKEKLMELGKQYRIIQLKVHKLILDSHASISKLEEIAARPNAIPLAAYMDLLIQRELDEGNHQGATALKASLKAAEWLTTARADWDPFDRPLSELKKIGLELKFDDEDCNVQSLDEPGGLIRALMKLIDNRKGTDNANEWQGHFGDGDKINMSCNPEILDERRVAERVMSMSTSLGRINGYELYELKKEELAREEDILGIYQVMKPNIHVTSEWKVVMFVGVTGAGKTSTINSLINYILEVKFDDEFRFKLIHEEVIESTNSMTNEVSAYMVHAQQGSRYPHNLIIIDSPGFADTRGLEEDKKLLNKFQMFYDEGKKWNITGIHAVGFVVRVCDSRLTEEQKYVFDSVLNVFGKNVEKAFVAVITFSDWSAQPPALNVLKAGGIPFNEVFMINNSPIFAGCKEGDEGMKRFTWDTSFEKMKRFCDRLESCEDASLDPTWEVLNKRLAIEDLMYRFRKELHTGNDILELLQIAFDALRKASAERANKSKLQKFGNAFRAVHLKIHGLILDARACISKLEEIALKPEAVHVAGYIDTLIKKGSGIGDEQKLKVLHESREAAAWLSAMRNQADWDPFEERLSDLKNFGLQLTFDGENSDVQFLQESAGILQTSITFPYSHGRNTTTCTMPEGHHGPKDEILTPSVPGETEMNPSVAERVRKMSSYVGKFNGYDLYELMKEEVCREENSFAIYNVIKPNTPVTSVTKVVMFVGKCGIGKTSTINSLINYIFGVTFDDEFRFKLIHEEASQSYISRTKEVSAYIVHAQYGSRFPHNIIIIDTPGFADASGLDAEKKLLRKFKRFFDEGKKWNITRIHAVGLVVPVSDSRLTVEQMYVFESVLGIFGKEVERSFVAVTTFSDGIFADCNKGNLDMKRNMWDANFEKIKLFCDRLESCEDASLDTTREVLDERLAIEDIMHRLQKEIHNGIDTLELLQSSYDVLRMGSAVRTNREKLRNFGRIFRDVQLKVHKLILEVRVSLSKLEKAALKLETVAITKYIVILIRRERRNNDDNKLKALQASREAAAWLTAMKHQANWDPFEKHLSNLETSGLQLTFDGEDCDVHFL